MFYSETEVTATYLKGRYVFGYQCWQAFIDMSDISVLKHPGCHVFSFTFISL